MKRICIPSRVLRCELEFFPCKRCGLRKECEKKFGSNVEGKCPLLIVLKDIEKGAMKIGKDVYIYEG